MKKILCLCCAVLLLFTGCNFRIEVGGNSPAPPEPAVPSLTYTLPAPKTDGDMSVEQAMQNRRSVRRFEDKALSKEQLSQLLWAAYGITQPITDNPARRGGLRTTPSAGALYPLEIYVVVGKADGIETGVYKYDSQTNTIAQTIDRDIREELMAISANQAMIGAAPVTILYCAVFDRMRERYGDRSERYAYIEVGHSAQNVYLQAESLGLGTCASGAFTDSEVSKLLNLPRDESPLYMMPTGYPQG